ncbi:MAG: nucleotidyltransferase family protein [Hydrogenophaga sp.]
MTNGEVVASLHRAEREASACFVRLKSLVAASEPTMEALRAVRTLGLASWCLAAGAIRRLVWDDLHGFASPPPLADWDCVFYDPAPQDPGREKSLEAALSNTLPGLRWEVVNQAWVHQWLQTETDGEVVAPFQSLADGIASWPETATCVGVWLTPEDSIEVIAPHGLGDLFGGVVRWNFTSASRTAFENRLKVKRWTERWPQIAVL